MKELFLNSKIGVGLLAVIIAVALLIPIAVVTGVGTVVAGTAIGVGAALNEGPANCKAPPNLFDAWETVRDFVTGVDCTDTCAVADGAANNIPANSAEYVKTIIGTGKAMGVSDKGQVIAITTALVESNLKNYANDGIYDTSRNPADRTLVKPDVTLGFIKLSLGFPHDAVGSDASSVGLFQQQAWWGTVGSSTYENDPQNAIKRLMDPVFQAQKFYDKMLGIANWEQMDYGVVAQRVQVSAVPTAYAKRVAEAQSLFAQYKGEAATVQLYDLGKNVAAGGGDSPSTAPACGTGGTGLVLDKSRLYQVTAQWAQPGVGIRQGRVHGGMDIDCGNDFENVYAPVDGVIVLSTNGNPSGSGTPEGHVYIKTADGTKIIFRHLRNTFVKAGSPVTAGTAVGECANTGNSYGTHLHIEADVSGSTNPALKALPSGPGSLSPGLRDPALALQILGVDICPPYTANRKTVGVGASLPGTYLACWPPQEWVR